MSLLNSPKVHAIARELSNKIDTIVYEMPFDLYSYAARYLVYSQELTFLGNFLVNSEKYNANSDLLELLDYCIGHMERNSFRYIKIK